MTMPSDSSESGSERKTASTPQLKQHVEAGQTWSCNEARATDPDHDAGGDYDGIGDRYLAFTAVVEHVDGDYVALEVTRRNRYLGAPDPGTTVVASAAKLQSQDTWELKNEAPRNRQRGGA